MADMNYKYCVLSLSTTTSVASILQHNNIDKLRVYPVFLELEQDRRQLWNGRN